LIPTHPDAIKKGRVDVSSSYSTNDTHRGFCFINPEISPHRTRFDTMVDFRFSFPDFIVICRSTPTSDDDSLLGNS
jgi:hypothetical protein